MTTYSLSEAKDKLSSIVKETAETTRPITISVNGRNQVVLISMEEYESMMDTIEILKDKELLKRISASLEDIKKGRLVKFEDIRRD